MSLKYKFGKARKVLGKLEPKDWMQLKKICDELRMAEADLQKSAKPLLEICNHRCEGLCCRNIYPDSLIGLWDMIYILATDRTIAGKISEAIQQEKPLFPSDCIFLENGVGPCIFQSDVRPEICITSFCFSETPLGKEISRVKWMFFKLRWYFRLRKFGVFNRLDSIIMRIIP